MLSKADRVLIAAYLLDKARPQAVLTLGELVLKAWELWPDEFGLTGYEELHPDSHHVRCVLYGNKMHSEWIVRKGPLRWEITKRGREAAADLYAVMDAANSARDAATQRRLDAAKERQAARKAERKAQEKAKELATNWPAY